MTVVNNNLALLDLPTWEIQTPAAAGASAAGVENVTDLRGSNRFIYQLFSATAFYRFDTYSSTWQQLPSPPGGTVGVGTSAAFDPGYGSTIKGSVWWVIANSAAPVFYNYDIGANTWSSAKTVTNMPATVTTDSYLCKPDPAYNLNGQNSYTNMNTVTLSSNAALNATTLSVSALPAAMAANTILNFGTSSAPLYAVVTAAAASSATSLTVSALAAAITSPATAVWCNTIYFVGSANTNLYAYSISGNSWSTATGAIPAADGAGCGLVWLPGYDPDKLILLRGAATANIYQYSMSGTSWTTLTFMPATDTFTTGTHTTVRTNPLVSSGTINNAGTMANRMLVQLNVTGKIYEFDPVALVMSPIATQWLVTDGAALVGNRLNYCVANGIEYVYYQLHTSTVFMRVGLNSQY